MFEKLTCLIKGHKWDLEHGVNSDRFVCIRCPKFKDVDKDKITCLTCGNDSRYRFYRSVKETDFYIFKCGKCGNGVAKQADDPASIKWQEGMERNDRKAGLIR